MRRRLCVVPGAQKPRRRGAGPVRRIGGHVGAQARLGGMALPRGPGMATRPICAGKRRIDPCVPRAWRSYSMRYQHQATCYQITVENPAGVTHGAAKIEPDGKLQPGGQDIPLLHDGKVHRVRAVLSLDGC